MRCPDAVCEAWQVPGAQDSWPGWALRVALWFALLSAPVVLVEGVDTIVDNIGGTAVALVFVGFVVWEWVFDHEHFWELDGG